MASLNVIALISGGKDSFYSLLHCLANGHRVVALANLHPPPLSADNADADLNSFMYQTVGHEVIPLYADATGLPLYRHAITGGAGDSRRDYGGSVAHHDEDETESMVPLLRRVMAAHPEANAVCAGAILSTYQRTRVESVALRLGLVPLAYLWKYPAIAGPASFGPVPGDDGAHLLRDMAAAGLEARIVKVASGGLDEEFLWEDVASPKGVARLVRAMSRFGCGNAGDGAVLGEGGEFETLVVNGPGCLFKKKILVQDQDKRIIKEGGGTAWLRIAKAEVVEKTAQDDSDGGLEKLRSLVRFPKLLDERFSGILAAVSRASSEASGLGPDQKNIDNWPGSKTLGHVCSRLEQWNFVAGTAAASSVVEETQIITDKIRGRLAARGMSATNIISATIVLRRMADFPAVNAAYGSLFVAPNPPSRVTISSGDLLPPGCDIYISLSVLDVPNPAIMDTSVRDGLHVQSRSYWAPANIGPYSQAITLPLNVIAQPNTSRHQGDDAVTSNQSPASGPRLVLIAGQIPLVPATMELPHPDDQETELDAFTLNATLSLQHLWRIAQDKEVQWWSSAVAYVSKTDNIDTARRKAIAAATVWAKTYDVGGDGDDASDDDSGPDIWDRKYNPAFMDYKDQQDQSGCLLPDFEVINQPSTMSQPVQSVTTLPPFFLAEVEELPRQSDVEWHAQAGFSNLEARSVTLRSLSSPSSEASDPKLRSWDAHQTLVQMRESGFVHTCVAIKCDVALGDTPMAAESLADDIGSVMLSLSQPATVGGPDSTPPLEQKPNDYQLLYFDASLASVPQLAESCAVIPCRSLWNSRGERVAAVAFSRQAMSIDN
ncbi:hypothetical protein PpBr36_08667 [Pyricularia pennisetigena]|uniref:hypothetical protein n=1 Tax=Pyricularia pennisetigena TaxID=1578925 RepID=UPI001154E227|nr:hypothetical protein PpBr36_08667 [Pyricularia pennisetigena]TLS23814.1 hypothetical protein PpBr36_08667 [Pyricularia pennisetigena]